MNRLPIGAITGCALAAVIGSFALMRDTSCSVEHRDAPAAASARIKNPAANPFLANERRRVAAPEVSPSTEPLPESDTTGLLQPQRTLDELLDEINADLGHDAVPVDREQLADVLRARSRSAWSARFACRRPLVGFESLSRRQLS